MGRGQGSESILFGDEARRRSADPALVPREPGLELLPFFSHFVVGLRGSAEAEEIGDWHGATARARELGYVHVLGIGDEATQILDLEGRPAGAPVALER
jgi:hypothetical protein